MANAESRCVIEQVINGQQTTLYPETKAEYINGLDSKIDTKTAALNTKLTGDINTVNTNLTNKIDTVESTLTTNINTVNTRVTTVNTDLTASINTKASNAALGTTNTNVSTLTTRVDELTNGLPSGTTQTDAWVAELKAGADGQSYTSPATAITTNFHKKPSFTEVKDVPELKTPAQQWISEINATGTQAKADMDTKAATTIASIPSDYTTLSNEVTDLKSDLSQNVDRITEKMVLVESLNKWNKDEAKSGYINPSDGSIDTGASTYKNFIIDVKPNDVIKSYIANPNVSGANMRFICAYNASGEVVPNSGSSSDEREFTVPSGIYKLGITIYASSNPTQMIIVNSATPTQYIPYFKPYFVASDDFIKNTAEITKITRGMKLVKPINLWNKDTSGSGYIDPSNGTISVNATYAYNYVAVKPNDVVRSFSGTSGADMRFICAYNASGEVVSSSGSSSELREFTVPSGIYKLGITTYASLNSTQMITVNYDNPIMYYPYETEHYVASDEFTGDKLIKPYTESCDTFSNTIQCPWGSSVQKNLTVCVTMDVGNDFSAAKIGFTNDIGYMVEIKVSRTYVQVWDLTFGTAVDTVVNHNLNIENNLQIRVRYDGTHKAYVDIASNGNTFSMSGDSLKRGHLKPNLSISGTVSNVHFTVVAEDINAPIWAFGDSYFANYSTRWVYHLMNSNYKNNVLLDAYSGEYSNDSFKDLTGLLTQGTPKRILWCLGMNDGSDTDANTPSSSWLENIQKVIGICEENEIELILATIPTVPTVNNEGKNKWVRNSGYQYVDFAKAVGASSSGVWYTDMLSDDGIHPDVKGAVALYNQLLTDFPQIMISK